MTLRVLVTGGRGFLGSHIVKELVHRGYEVKVVDNLSSRGFRAPSEPGVEYLQLDLRDRSKALLAFERVDACIALAARCGGIGFFNRLQAEILDDNTRILSASFEAARVHGIRKMVYVSSSCVFDRTPVCPVSESSLDSSPTPPAGYPSSKLLGEHYCKAYSQQFHLTYTIVRPFNAYGPGEMPGSVPGESHVIPDLAAKLLRGQVPLEIFGDGRQTRSFTYVRDVARGVVLAMGNPRATNEDFNLGYPVEVSVLQLAEVLWKVCGRVEPFAVKSVAAFDHDVRRRAVDITKARDFLGWEPEVDLESGLADTVNWLRAQLTVGSLNQ